MVSAPLEPRVGAPLAVRPREPADGEREQQPGLDREAGDGIDGNHLPQQPVKSEAAAQGQADPQLPERTGREHEISRRGDRDRDPLQPCKPFLEHEPAEEDVGERGSDSSRSLRRGCAR
jgi:hypothetical protein